MPKALKVLQILLIVFAVYVMIFTLVSIKNLNNDAGKGFMGFKLFTVLSDSMKPEFQAGDIIISKIVDSKELKVGDIITFYSSNGLIVTHQIQEKIVHESKDAFITKGTNVNQVDNDPALAENVIGRYSFSIPKAGLFFQFLKTTMGYITLILIPFLIIITINGVKFVKVFREFKNEKQKEIEIKKAELEKENKRLFEELKQLKEQLNNTGNNG
jgi:signal peptidase